MSKKNPNYEYAIGTGRILQAARSLQSWQKFENVRLAAERRLFAEELRRSTDPSHIADVRKAMAENTIEQEELDVGWKNSSLRARVERTDPKILQDCGVETRDYVGTDSGRKILSEPEHRAKSKVAKFTGHAGVFNSDSVDLGGFVETLEPGAFGAALKISDVRGLVNHNSDLIFSRGGKRGNSLRLYEDSVGLKFYADLMPGDSLCDEIINRVSRGIWSQCSYCFKLGPNGDRWEYSKQPGGLDRRIIKRDGIQEIFDISVVSFPAYPSSTCSLLFEDRAEPDHAQISDARTSAAFARLQAFDSRRKAREEKAERERSYIRLGKMIEKNNAEIAHAKMLGARPVSNERQRQCLVEYHRAGDTIRRMGTAIENEKEKQRLAELERYSNLAFKGIPNQY